MLIVQIRERERARQSEGRAKRGQSRERARRSEGRAKSRVSGDLRDDACLDAGRGIHDAAQHIQVKSEHLQKEV